MPELFKTDEALELTFNGYRDYQMHADAVKAVPGRRYDGETKAWQFPLSPEVAERLMVTVRPRVDPAVMSWIQAAKADAASELVSKIADDADVMVPWGRNRVPWQPEKLGKPGEEVPFTGLFPYQRALVDAAMKAAENGRLSVLVADDMGLGKCGQSASVVMEYLLRKSAFAADLEPPLEHFKSASDLLAWAGVDDGPKVAIAPSSVKGTWSRELRMWLGQDIPHVVVDGSTFKRRHTQLEEAIEANAWAVVNWEQIRTKKENYTKKTKMVHPITGEFIRWKEVVKEREVMREPLFETTPWVAAIADEAHRAKNRKSLQTRGLWRIDAPIKLALTGTPLMNTPDELWAVLKWLYPEQYKSYWSFYNQYVDFYEGQFGKIITGVKNADALRFELSGRLIRRTKKEVLKDLPDKTRVYDTIPLNPKQRKLYDEAEREMWFEVEQAVKAGDKAAIQFVKGLEAGKTVFQVPNGAARIVRLRQIASSPALLGGEDDSAKLDAAVERIMDNQPKQFVVFSEFVGTCEILVERLRKQGLRAESWTGERSTVERTHLENDFQAGEVDVIVGTISAMKEGVTLTAADTVIFLERHWTPAINEQCEDRLHRVGQKKNVTVVIIDGEDTVDTNKVSVTNAIKHLIVTAVIHKDDVKEIR